MASSYGRGEPDRDGKGQAKDAGAVTASCPLTPAPEWLALLAVTPLLDRQVEEPPEVDPQVGGLVPCVVLVSVQDELQLGTSTHQP
jgi:hypothetical protein